MKKTQIIIAGLAGAAAMTAAVIIYFPSAKNYVTPEQFGACHCQDSTTDAKAIQSAFNTGKKVEFDGTATYYLGTLLTRPKLKNFNVNGNGATLIVTTSQSGDVIGCAQPVSVTEAVQMQNYSVSISNLLISCKTKLQNGVNVKASSNDRFENITVTNAGWGFRSEFMLQSRYTLCTVLSSTNGFYIGTGTFAGADLNNSQSNESWLVNPHCWTVSGTCILFENVYGCRADDVIAEGNVSPQIVIDFQSANSTTTKDLQINTIHYEATGAFNAANVLIRLNTRDVTATINNVITHYPVYLIDATSSTGTGNVIFSNCNYAATTPDNKYFKSNNCTWVFEHNNMFPGFVLPNMFIGTAPRKYIGDSGYNQYTSIDLPR